MRKVTRLERARSWSITLSTMPSCSITLSHTMTARSMPYMSRRYLMAFGSKYVFAGILNHCMLLFLRAIRLMLSRLIACTLPETELPP